MTQFEEETASGLQPIEPSMARLTPRETQVMSLLTQGLTNRAIAQQLRIAEGTVKKLVYNCYQKLGIASRVELVLLLVRFPQTMERLRQL